MYQNTPKSDPHGYKAYPYPEIYAEYLDIHALSGLEELLNIQTFPSMHTFSFGTKDSPYWTMLIDYEHNFGGKLRRSIFLKFTFSNEHNWDFNDLIRELGKLSGVMHSETRSDGKIFNGIYKPKKFIQGDPTLIQSSFTKHFSLNLCLYRRRDEIYSDDVLFHILTQLGGFWIKKGSIANRVIGIISGDLLKESGDIPRCVPQSPDLTIDPRNSSEAQKTSKYISLDIARTINGYPIDEVPEEFIPNTSSTEQYNQTIRQAKSIGL